MIPQLALLTSTFPENCFKHLATNCILFRFDGNYRNLKVITSKKRSVQNRQSRHSHTLIPPYYSVFIVHTEQIITTWTAKSYPSTFDLSKDIMLHERTK